MANNNSRAGDLGKGVLGVGLGFALYFLIRNFRFGGGFGLGGGRGEQEAGPGPGPDVPAVPSPRPAPPRPRDAEPLLFVVVHPEGMKARSDAQDAATRARRDAVFHLVDLGAEKVTPAQIYQRAGTAIRGTKPLTIDDVAARVKAGGRDDVRLINMGGIRSGTWDDVLDALMDAGISHWLLWEQPPADRQPSGSRPAQPPMPPKWDLYTKSAGVGNPDRTGHYLFGSTGTAYWGLDRRIEDDVSASHVSGSARGHYRRGRWSGG